MRLQARSDRRGLRHGRKIVLADTWDTDGDNIPDDADGFNLLGETTALDDDRGPVQFVPILADVTGADLQDARLVVNHGAASPTTSINTSNGHLSDTTAPATSACGRSVGWPTRNTPTTIRQWLSAHNLDVNDPRFGRWIQQSVHQQPGPLNHGAFNDAWGRFMRAENSKGDDLTHLGEREYTEQQILDFMTQVNKDYFPAL